MGFCILKEVLSGVAAIEGQTTIEGAQEMRRINKE